jgi:hypothetical protein
VVEFFSVFESTGSAGGSRELEELILSDQPATVMVFSSSLEDVQLHYEKEGALRGYTVCPGAGCPFCKLDEKPRAYWLMPVLDLGSDKVKVLRLSEARGSKSLVGQLSPYMKRADTADIALRITRVGFDHTVKAVPIAEHADRGAAAVQAFQTAQPDLRSVYRHLTVEEIAEIARVRKLLDALKIDTKAPTQSPEKS